MPEHANLTGAELHEPKGVSGASSNQTYVASGGGTGTWSEPEPKGAIGEDANKVYVSDGSNSGAWTPLTLAFTHRIPDISTADTVYIPMPYAGEIVKVITVIDGAIATADATITVRDSANSAMAAIVVANAGSAAGDVDTAAPASNNIVTADDFISVATDGASSGTVEVTVTVILERS